MKLQEQGNGTTPISVVNEYVRFAEKVKNGSLVAETGMHIPQLEIPENVNLELENFGKMIQQKIDKSKLENGQTLGESLHEDACLMDTYGIDMKTIKAVRDSKPAVYGLRSKGIATRIFDQVKIESGNHKYV